MLRDAQAATGIPDDDRPLTERRVHQAEAAVLALARLGTRIDVCMSSPRLRAVQMGERECRSASASQSNRRYRGEPFELRALTAGLDDVLLVGHDPSFSLTLHDLSGAQARIRKGGLAGSRRAN